VKKLWTTLQAASLCATTIAIATAFAESSFGYSPKEGNVTATLGSFLYRTNVPESAVSAGSELLPGIGIVASGDVNDKGGLEIGVFDLRKKYFREQAGLFVSEQTEVLHITMGYRRWLSSGVSCSLTVYSAFTLGSVAILKNDFYPGSLQTSARDIVNYGFDFALQTELFTHDRFAAVLDSRYSLAVSHRPGERADHYLFMLGVRYLIQSKQSKESKELKEPKEVKESKDSKVPGFDSGR
jgi:hypothetical protein